MKSQKIIFPLFVLFAFSFSTPSAQNTPSAAAKNDTASAAQSIKNSQNTAQKTPDSVNTTAGIDSAGVQNLDSLSSSSAQSPAVKEADSLVGATAPADTAAAQKQEEKKLKLVRRTHTGRQQVVLAASMMIFVVGIMTLAQQWNPR